MTGEGFFLSGEEAKEPYPYKGCGLDGIYLLNGYTVFEHDGDRHVKINNVPGLHQAIGRFIVRNRKGLSPKEIRFLRNTMDLTQAQLAAKLGNTSQSVARWEKGECEIPGTAEKLLRAVYLASLRREDDLQMLRLLLEQTLEELDELDQMTAQPAQFELFDRWEERPAA